MFDIFIMETILLLLFNIVEGLFIIFMMGVIYNMLKDFVNEEDE